jgi:hypothetical protein
VTTPTAADMAPCWADDLTLADGQDPGLVDVPRGRTHPALEADCDEPHAYEVWLDGQVWAEHFTILCAEHAAKIRALPHGGLVRIQNTNAERVA